MDRQHSSDKLLRLQKPLEQIDDVGLFADLGFDPAMQNKHENIQSLPQSNAPARNRAIFFVFIQEIFTQVEITIPEGSHRPETQRNRDLFVLRL